MSTFEVPVVTVKLEEHPNADKLSIVRVFGYQVVVRTEDWEDGQLAAYVPPESVVDIEREEFRFLDAPGMGNRIKAHRFRKEWSYGLLVPAPKGSKLGDNVAEKLDVIHYEPKVNGVFAKGSGKGADDQASPPKDPGILYDIENWRRHRGVMDNREDLQVYVTEKVHGANIRMTYQDGKFHVASRRFYRKEFYEDKPHTLWGKIKRLFKGPILIESTNPYWVAFKKDSELMELVKNHEGVVFYGEVYGSVQDKFHYDTDGRYNKIRLFDAFDPKTGVFWRKQRFYEVVPRYIAVPLDYVGPYDPEKIEEICQSPSQLTSRHIREGVVITPADEVQSVPGLGRMILKCVNPRYLEKL